MTRATPLVWLMPLLISASAAFAGELTAYGRARAEPSRSVTHLVAVREGTVTIDGNRIDIDRGPLVEWLFQSPEGLRHGFTLATPPNGERGRVVFDLKLEGAQRPVVSEDGQSVHFFDAGSVSVLRYGALKATDAAGREAPARFEVISGAIRIGVDDGLVAYPLSVELVGTTAAWTASGDENDARLGMSVAPAGDVNGDGYSDVIVGANFHDAGAGSGANRGRAYIYLGTASGIAASPASTVSGDENNSQFGNVVAPAGDVNGDGYGDVLVSAYMHDAGGGANANRGRAYLYLGSAAGLVTSPAWTASGDEDNDAFGFAVAGAGDVNGDGFADVIVGAYTHDGGAGAGADRGQAYLYLGSAGGLAPSPVWTITGDENNALVGAAVATAGDVNGDGFADVIAGAFGHDAGAGAAANRGRAYVYLGSSSGLAASPVWTGSGDENGAFYGACVSTAGDVDGNGYADILVSAYQHDASGAAGANRGRAYLYMSFASGPNSIPGWTRSGDENLAFFGQSLGTAGDVNGDGYADVIVGANGHDAGAGAGADRGQAYMFLGSGGGLDQNPVWTVSGDENSNGFARSVATAGDVNGDGFSDLIVGAYVHDAGAGAAANRGRAYAYLGTGGIPSTSPSSTRSGQHLNGEFGHSVASAGDVNGDGYSDVLVSGVRDETGTGTERGQVYLHRGSELGLIATPAATLAGDQDFADFGSSVASAGDVNGDGYSDVVVGAEAHDAGALGTTRGQAYVFLGSAGGLATIPVWTASGDEDSARLGGSVATAGDVNGDGYSDVIVGAFMHDAGAPNSHRGRAYLYLGSPSGLATNPAWIASGGQADARFGSSVATAGDVNGDGYSDVVVGAPLNANGRASLFLGSANGLATSPAWIATGEHAGDLFGTSVASAGDVNGDGYSDVVVGAVNYDGRGRAYLYLGSPTGLSELFVWRSVSDEINAGVGNSVASAGDLNGDGYSDVIVGAYTHDATAGLGADRGRAYVYLGSAAGLATAYSWAGSGDQDDAEYGYSVATAGDVDGDGSADIIVGADLHDAGGALNANRGRAYVYYGNGEGQIGGGLDRIPRQVRTDAATPIALLGHSDSEVEFRVRARGRTAAGRGRIALQWQAKPLGTPFDDTGIDESAPQDTGVPGVLGSATSFNASVSGLVEGTFYRWRLRTVSTDPFFPRSTWMSLAGNNVTETKLRTPGCIDRDGDGYGDAVDAACAGATADCNDHDVTIWGTPGETANLRFTSKTTLVWDPPLDPGALSSVLTYDTLRSGIPSNFLGAADCVETSDGPNTSAVDSTTPSLGQVFYYLGRTKNACAQGVGTFGANSQGVTRATRSCP